MHQLAKARQYHLLFRHYHDTWDMAGNVDPELFVPDPALEKVSGLNLHCIWRVQ
jgi:hypothetical protein